MNYEIEELAQEYVMDYLRNELIQHSGYELADVDVVSELVGDRLADSIACDIQEMVRNWLDNHGCQCHDECEMEAESSHNEALDEHMCNFREFVGEYLNGTVGFADTDITSQQVLIAHGTKVMAAAKKDLFTDEEFAFFNGGNADECNYLDEWLQDYLNDNYKA